jgi:hypothetical protein
MRISTTAQTTTTTTAADVEHPLDSNAALGGRSGCGNITDAFLARLSSKAQLSTLSSCGDSEQGVVVVVVLSLLLLDGPYICSSPPRP